MKKHTGCEAVMIGRGAKLVIHGSSPISTANKLLGK